MTEYGVTSTGFVKKTYDVIKQEVKEDLWDKVNSKLNLLDTSTIGQIVGVFSDKLREMWDVQESVYNAQYPETATGASLDESASYNGVTRLAATKGTVTLDGMYLDDGTTVPAGSIVGVGPTGSQWVTLAAVTNSTGVPATFSVSAEARETGVLQGYAGEIDTIITAVSGWSAAPAITNTTNGTWNLDGTSLTLKVDRGGTQTVNFAGGNPWAAADVATEIKNNTTGIDAYAVNLKVRVATETEGDGGSIQITGGTANSLLSFDTGELKGFNTEDADVGTDVEEDPAFRARREQLLRIAGSGTLEAVRSAVLDVSGVLQAFVLENETGVTDSDGVPPHSFEVIAQQAAWTAAEEEAVAQAIWDNKPLGIDAYGSTDVTITDSQGFDNTVSFSKSSEIPIHLEYTLDTDDNYPSNGDDLVKAAVAAYGNSLTIGEDVIALQFKSVPLDIAGVNDVTSFKVDIVDPPTGTTNISIPTRSQATFDTSDIDIT